MLPLFYCDGFDQMDQVFPDENICSLRSLGIHPISPIRLSGDIYYCLSVCNFTFIGFTNSQKSNLHLIEGLRFCGPVGQKSLGNSQQPWVKRIVLALVLVLVFSVGGYVVWSTVSLCHCGTVEHFKIVIYLVCTITIWITVWMVYLFPNPQTNVQEAQSDQ